MQKVLLFGSTGNLGKEIAKVLVGRGYDVTAVVRNQQKADNISQLVPKTIIADVLKADALNSLSESYDIIVSALGKSVSPNERSKPTFEEVDLNGNTNILRFALKRGVKKFVYISAVHAERYQHLTYFRVHHEFSELLKASGIDYSIIKPPALFSAFLDVIAMARKGQLVNLGEGDKKTNPIFEGDLAKIVVDAIDQPNATVEAGGKAIYSRKQLNEIINKEVNSGKKLSTIPVWVPSLLLPILKLVDKNMYDKFAFFVEVTQHDTLAPQVGEMSFEEYVRVKSNE